MATVTNTVAPVSRVEVVSMRESGKVRASPLTMLRTLLLPMEWLCRCTALLYKRVGVRG